jgi:hypothetical protein
MPRRHGWIDWKKSHARAIILEDLELEILPIDAAQMPAAVAWELYYGQMAEFNEVVFSQFEARLKDHRKKYGKLVIRSARESEALAHDRRLFPRQNENCRGEPVFDLSAAKLLLRADVAEGKHTSMTPSQLQATRDEYKPFDSRKFKHRIYQEVRRIKFLNWLDQNRRR